MNRNVKWVTRERWLISPLAVAWMAVSCLVPIPATGQSTVPQSTVPQSGVPQSGGSTENGPADKIAEEQEAAVRRLIGQLGDPQYPTREKAEEELKSLGTVAFDALLAAQDHRDVEIAQRARYLVRSMHVGWSQESDSQEIRSLLADYSKLGRNERRTRAQHLATLEKGVGVAPLCRLVRYEPDRVLSKQAALLILARSVPAHEADRNKLAITIRDSLGTSQRPAIEWLETYVRELERPSSTLADWDRITRQELLTLAKTPQHSDREVTRDLLRWQTRLLLSQRQTQLALENFRRTFDLIQDSAAEVFEAIDWSIANELYAAPDDIAKRFADRVQGDPRLLYRLAEAQAKRGDRVLANQTATTASELNAGKIGDHLAIATLLDERGLREWAAVEYRLVLAVAAVDSNESISAREQLSKMLFDMERETEAADVVKPLVEYVAKEGKNNELIQAVNGHFRGYMHYWYGLAAGKRGDRAAEKDQLQRAIEASPTNIDILIAMNRVPEADEAWRKDVRTRIDSHVGKCRILATKYEDLIRQQPQLAAAASDELATAYNELAWLVSNTDGDAQEALRASRRSLELSPNNEAYLDTLGRCYYAAGDLENAVKFQRRAVSLSPHLEVMKRQLKLFEDALAAQNK